MVRRWVKGFVNKLLVIEIWVIVYCDLYLYSKLNIMKLINWFVTMIVIIIISSLVSHFVPSIGGIISIIGLGIIVVSFYNNIVKG
jgi:hypothetical protein